MHLNFHPIPLHMSTWYIVCVLHDYIVGWALYHGYTQGSVYMWYGRVSASGLHTKQIQVKRNWKVFVDTD